MIKPWEGSAPRADVIEWIASALHSRDASELSEDEHLRANRLAEPARARYISARIFLRQTLARKLSVSPREVIFSYGPHGKPDISHPPTDITFNVSHSEDLVAIALAKGLPVGVDIERLRPVPNAIEIGKRVLFEAEIAELQQAPSDERHATFLRIWTRHEARTKALGGSIWHGLGAQQLQISEFEPAAGYVGAIAWAGSAEYQVRPLSHA
jgi:4'-phosphopantetheinyl transferase